ncbi:hypothetical protein D1610_12035 [Sphingomonas gilva]|uniref:PEGA domain-containing protein n=1 Tax=Sphingomonas gilva TaxID=2305907 RepID=A0A396RSF2_9SPHN|nr:hypothetical protein [Sphingomonas gilva]RHW17263.1 hypothetical protein D1610_12035 [Sphingomonas gilva]
MNTYLRLGAAVLVASSLSACATITRGTKQNYEITSQPPGADVALSTGDKCVTPCKLKLKRKDAFTAKFAKAGYEPMEANVESKLSGGGGAAAAGNLLFGGIIGGVVDGSNGSLNSLYPGKLEVTLVPASSAEIETVADAVEAALVTAEPADAVAEPAAATTEPTDAVVEQPVAEDAVATPAPTEGL